MHLKLYNILCDIHMLLLTSYIFIVWLTVCGASGLLQAMVGGRVVVDPMQVLIECMLLSLVLRGIGRGGSKGLDIWHTIHNKIIAMTTKIFHRNIISY